MSDSKKNRTVGVLLFQDFEPLDVFGPVEAFVIARHEQASTGEISPFRIAPVMQR